MSIRSIALPGFIIALFLLLAGLASSQQRTAVPSPAVPAPPRLGRLVDVEGHLTHIYCSGMGSPTVILEAGAGGFSFDWGLVQPKVAKFTRVCSYDRAGSAWSELGPQPRTIKQKVHDLHALLLSAKVKGPYVLASHSGGGYIIREYQASYPNEVVGMVLAESGHENSLFLINGNLVRMPELSKGRPIPGARAEMKDSEKTIPPDVLKQIEKSMELFGPPANDPPYNKLPANIQQIRLWALAQPTHLLADDNPFEGEEMAALYADRRKQEYPLGDLPLIVLHREIGGYKPITKMISAEQVQQLETERLVLNQEMVKLSRNSAHIVARNSTHDIHLDRPELVVDATDQVVEAARHHGSVKHDEIVK